MAKKEQWVPINLADMFLTSAELRAENEVLRYKKGHHYESLTYFELKNEVMKLAQALISLGFKMGDKVLLISENRPEWVISDLALQLIGGVSVPVHEVLSAPQLAEIIEEIKPKAIFFSEKAIEDKLLEISTDVAKVEHLVSFNHIEETKFGKLIYLKKLIEETTVSEADEAKIAENALKIKPDTLASIIYTSGTTGHLKGVKLTHGNFIANIVGTTNAIWILPTDKFFSILPLSHVFERTAGYYIPIYAGASIGYCLSLDTLSQEIQEYKPTIVLAVPRLYEKIYEKVQASANKSIVTKLIFKAAFVTKKSSPLYPLFDKLVFSKVKGNFGGNIRFFISGGASLPKKIGQFFAKVDMLVLEGYGLTETAPIVAVNEISSYRFGTVGHVINNVDMKLGKDGEILLKGPTITPGYLKVEDNEEGFTADGYFRTGDLGIIDEDGFLTISGRKKDLMVLTTGKKVAPVPIENALESSVYIEQAFVFGDGRKHIGALIVPDYAKLEEQYGNIGKAKLAKMKEVNELIAAEAIAKTSHLSSIEHVRKFVILSEPFSIQGGELTPKLSLRRQAVLEKYAECIESAYDSSELTPATRVGRFDKKRLTKLVFFVSLLILSWVIFEVILKGFNVVKSEFGIDPVLFFWVLAVAEVFFDFGVVLIILGSGAIKLKLKHIMNLDFSSIVFENKLVYFGFSINRIAAVVPPVYLLLTGWGKLPMGIVLLVLVELATVFMIASIPFSYFKKRKSVES